MRFLGLKAVVALEGIETLPSSLKAHGLVASLKAVVALEGIETMRPSVVQHAVSTVSKQ